MFYQEDGETFIVLDFETSGMSPEKGDRAIEVGAVRVRGGRIVDSFQSLINPGFVVSRFIEDLTGIDNASLREAPSAGPVMREFARFIGESPLLAHNAAFDGKFLDAEFALAGLRRRRPFCCTLKMARRLYPDSPNHRLETLVRYKAIEAGGSYHRALADAQMCARLLVAMQQDIRSRYGVRTADFALMERLCRTPLRQVERMLKKQAQADSGPEQSLAAALQGRRS